MALDPLRIWAVSDGRAGMEAQAQGLGEAIARQRPARLDIRRIAYRGGAGRLPWPLIWPPRALLRPGSGISPPWPDIWIATGRATLPFSMRMRRWSRGRTFVVQTQDPRTSLSAFDLVAPPLHDRLEGPNVFPILGAPNRVTQESLAAARARFADRLAGLAHPRICVAVGGRSKAHDLPSGLAGRMAREIADAIEGHGGSLMLTFSRRTPPEARQAMTRELSAVPGWIWDETGDNPYFGFLAHADAVLVTEDSTNLATDAAATGRPVFVLPMAGHSRKLADFHAELRARGISAPFSGSFEGPAYTPLCETERLAAEVLRRFDLAREAGR